jgi:hypothetical protein
MGAIRGYVQRASLMPAALGATDGVLATPRLGSSLALAASRVLCRTRRSTTDQIIAVGEAHAKHFNSQHRLVSEVPWPAPCLWLGILRVGAMQLCPRGPLVLVGEDPVHGESGRKIPGASNWRNACGPTHQQDCFLWGPNLVTLGLTLQRHTYSVL